MSHLNDDHIGQGAIHEADVFYPKMGRRLQFATRRNPLYANSFCFGALLICCNIGFSHVVPGFFRIPLRQIF